MGATGENGTCLTASQCLDRGGSANGGCAGGYGVCCVCKYIKIKYNKTQKDIILSYRYSRASSNTDIRKEIENCMCACVKILI